MSEPGRPEANRALVVPDRCSGPPLRFLFARTEDPEKERRAGTDPGFCFGRLNQLRRGTDFENARDFRFRGYDCSGS